MYVYIQSEPGLWTVGFYDPAGQWHPESDHADRESAAARVHYLNGSCEAIELQALICEREGMIAENLQRARLDQSLAYVEDSFLILAEKVRKLAARIHYQSGGSEHASS